MKFIRALLIALLLLAMACGSPPQQTDREAPPDRSDSAALPRFQSKPEQMSEALRQVTALVEATGHAAAADAVVSAQGDNGSTKPCETDKDLVYASYGVEIQLEDNGARLFDDAVSFWRDNGYDVVVQEGSSDAPSAYLNLGDFNFQLYVNSLSKLAFIGGSTPCYAPSK